MCILISQDKAAAAAASNIELGQSSLRPSVAFKLFILTSGACIQFNYMMD